MNNFLKPIREKRTYYENNPEEVDRVLSKGTKEAQAKAKEMMVKIRRSMKIDYYN